MIKTIWFHYTWR